jgi:3-hydroxybutyryl-CoA dehydrogenase
MSGETKMNYEIRKVGESRAFPEPHALMENGCDSARVLVVMGQGAGIPEDHAAYDLVLVEIDDKCLSACPGLDESATNVMGFARWRLGELAPSDLVELVRLDATPPEAIATARTLLEEAGFQVSLCADRSGRILDRLLRPQFNLALTSVDDGLATGEDLDQCLKLGLGYRRGLLAPVVESGLEHHYKVTSDLFATYGLPQYAPARAAVVAHQRKEAE